MKTLEIQEKEGVVVSKTSGFKKYKNYLSEIIKSDNLQTKIESIRKKYKDFIKQDIPELNKTKSPEESSVFFEKINSNGRKNIEICRDFVNEMSNLCEYISEYYKVPNLRLLEIIEHYIIYNEIEIRIKYTDAYSFNMLTLFDVLKSLDNYKQKYKKIQLKHFKTYPIAILLSPYASENDIIDYIKKVYMINIKPLQEQYIDKKIKFGKIRKKNSDKEKRNNFIYKNKELPIKEIRKLVTKEFKEYLDDGHIGKIISLEKKKRN